MQYDAFVHNCKFEFLCFYIEVLGSSYSTQCNEIIYFSIFRIKYILFN